MSILNLPPLRAASARQFNYYVIPKDLIKHPVFAGLNLHSKFMYSLMLNRAALSAAHPDKFTDERGRLFIIYPVEQFIDEMNIAKATVIKALKELEEYGLIEKKRQGQGKPSLIFLMDFSAATDLKPSHSQKYTGERESDYQDRLLEVYDDEPCDLQKYNNDTSRGIIHELSEVQETDFLKYKNYTSRSTAHELPEVQKTDRIKKNIETDIINPSFPQEEDRKYSRWCMFSREERIEGIKDQISYDYLIDEFPNGLIDDVVLLIEETLVHPELVKLSGQPLSPAAVRDKFFSVDAEGVEWAIEKLFTMPNVQNSRAYLRTLLYNSSLCYELEAEGQAHRDLKVAYRKEE